MRVFVCVRVCMCVILMSITLEFAKSFTVERECSLPVSRIEFLFGTCYARCDGPCEVPLGLGAKTYTLLHWPATGLRRHHKPNLFSFVSLHTNIFGLRIVLTFVVRSYLLRRKRVSGEITGFSHQQGCPRATFAFLCLRSFVYQPMGIADRYPRFSIEKRGRRIRVLNSKGHTDTELSSLMVRDGSGQFFFWSFVIKNITVTNKPNFLPNLLLIA